MTQLSIARATSSGMTSTPNNVGIAPNEGTQAPDKGLPPYTGEYSRENVIKALDELYWMGVDEMRDLACMYGRRLNWTPSHLHQGAHAEAEASASTTVTAAAAEPAPKKARVSGRSV